MRALQRASAFAYGCFPNLMYPEDRYPMSHRLENGLHQIQERSY